MSLQCWWPPPPCALAAPPHVEAAVQAEISPVAALASTLSREDRLPWVHSRDPAKPRLHGRARTPFQSLPRPSEKPTRLLGARSCGYASQCAPKPLGSPPLAWECRKSPQDAGVPGRA